MRLRLNRLVAGGAIVMLLGALGAPAWAQGTGGFGAAPAHPNPADPATRSYFKPVIARGQSLADQALMTSTSDQPTTLYISAVDGLTGQTSGAVTISPVSRSRTRSPHRRAATSASRKS